MGFSRQEYLSGVPLSSLYICIKHWKIMIVVSYLVKKIFKWRIFHLKLVYLVIYVSRYTSDLFGHLLRKAKAKLMFSGSVDFFY